MAVLVLLYHHGKIRIVIHVFFISTIFLISLLTIRLNKSAINGDHHIQLKCPSTPQYNNQELKILAQPLTIIIRNDTYDKPVNVSALKNIFVTIMSIYFVCGRLLFNINECHSYDGYQILMITS